MRNETKPTLSQQELTQLIRLFKEHEQVQQMKEYIQHGRISIYEHVVRVTKCCLIMNRRFSLGADERVLVAAAFLHDFYLYDWHEDDDSHKWHGFYHPEKARQNAVRYFQIGEHEQEIIASHMWPLTLRKLPRSREAWILCLADKYVSTQETLFSRKVAEETERRSLLRRLFRG